MHSYMIDIFALFRIIVQLVQLLEAEIVRNQSHYSLSSASVVLACLLVRLVLSIVVDSLLLLHLQLVIIHVHIIVSIVQSTVIGIFDVRPCLISLMESVLDGQA